MAGRAERSEAADILRDLVHALDRGELVAVEADDVPSKIEAELVAAGVRAGLMGAPARLDAA